MGQFIGILGLVAFTAMAFAISNNKKKINKQIVGWGFGLQIFFALLVLGIPALGFDGPLRFIFDWANGVIIALLGFTDEGSKFLFGGLVDFSKFGFIFAFQVLPTIIFFSTLMGVLYHLGVMQKLVQVIAILMQKALGTSGAESLSVAANIFIGQTEAPLVVRPYLNKMTKSELMAVMVGGMATVAGGVMAAYVGLLKGKIPDIAGHLLTASVMSAPAAFVFAKIMYPETEKPETLGGVPKDSMKSDAGNAIEAAANGASDGLKLALNVAAMLLAFIALIAMCDAILGFIGGIIQFDQWGASLVPDKILGDKPAVLSLSLVFGWVFAPLAWLMGIPWSEAAVAGSLLGQKVAINEFVAYLNMSQMMDQLSDRTVIILSYALCGFANFSSIGIQIGGIGPIAPDRRSDLAQLGIRAVIGGSLAAFMTATIAGILI